MCEVMIEWRKMFAAKVTELDDLHTAFGELLKR
jgi:hypothetical protein